MHLTVQLSHQQIGILSECFYMQGLQLSYLKKQIPQYYQLTRICSCKKCASKINKLKGSL
jgi:hypothetical protein